MDDEGGDGVGRRMLVSVIELARRRRNGLRRVRSYAALREVVVAAVSICAGATRARGALMGVLALSMSARSFAAIRMYDFRRQVRQRTGLSPKRENKRSMPLRRRRHSAWQWHRGQE
jgi:hypothetical protein